MQPTQTPPRFFFRFFRWYCHPKLVDHIEGDLLEAYGEQVKTSGKIKADIQFVIDVLLLFRPGILRPMGVSKNQNHNSMLYGNYLKTALRSSLKNKVYSALNISGLSIGMTVTLLIGLWIWDELSLNTAEREHYATIAQVIQNVNNNGKVETWTSVPYPLAEEIRSNYSGDFDFVVTGTNAHQYLLAIGDDKFTKTGAFFEANFPHLFTLPMMAGTRDGLAVPNSVFISKSCALACFGSADALDKPILIAGSMQAKVTGVYDDFPLNSTFASMDFIASWEMFAEQGDWIKNMSDPWRPNAFNLYVKLNDITSFEQASLKIKDEKLKHINTELAKKNPQLFLWPMQDWHLYSDFRNGVNVGGRIQHVWMFGIIGSFVLLLACINFMNLCTARSERRAKEIGIRKSIGSMRSQLIQQFFTESFLMVFASLAVALVAAQLLLPFFNLLAGKTIVIPWLSPLFWGAAFAFCFFTGLVAGSYPAFYLSSFNSVHVLKGTFRAGGGTTLFRRTLVVVQFSVSVTLIIGTMVVFKQIEHARNRPMGYETSRIISVHMMNDKIHDHLDVFKTELINTEAIISVGEASTAPTTTWATSSGFSWDGKDPNLSVDFPFLNVSKDFGKTIGWEVLQGRDFSDEFLSDSSAIILNEAAVKYMELKEPLGAIVRWFDEPHKVIGIVKDLIMQSPYEPVKPTVFALGRESQNMLLVRLNPQATTSAALGDVEKAFVKYNPEQPFEYQFLDEEYGRKFGDEERIGKLASAFAALAILISCLGIFGLAAFVAERRTKEVGIRKVMGASVMNVWQLISKEFVVLVMVSCFIALPTGYYLLNKWLSGFTYRTEISWWIFAISFGGALAITLLTVSTQAIRAALANPVKSLRAE